MSVQHIQSNVERIQRDILSLRQKLSEESKNEASKSARISQIKQSINNSSYTNQSTIQSKYREIERIENELVGIRKRRADLDKKLADRTSELYRYEQQLSRERDREQKKMLDSFKRREEEMKRRQDDLLRDATRNIRSIPETHVSSVIEPAVNFDAFISHATEDKEELVRPLAEKLKEAGFEIWYDEFQLKVGDSLRRSIDKGLANSRFGIVILSPSFFAKNWSQYELDGLVAREMNGGKVILPLWHKITKNQVMEKSPTLADRFALNTTMYTIEELAKELGDALRGGLS